MRFFDFVVDRVVAVGLMEGGVEVGKLSWSDFVSSNAVGGVEVDSALEEFWLDANVLSASVSTLRDWILSSSAELISMENRSGNQVSDGALDDWTVGMDWLDKGDFLSDRYMLLEKYCYQNRNGVFTFQRA